MAQIAPHDLQGERRQVRGQQPRPPHDAIRINADQRTAHRGGVPKRRDRVNPDGVAEQRVVHHRQGANQHDVPTAAQNARQFLILGGFGRLGKQDVKANDFGVGLVKLLDQAGMQTARPGPLLPDLGHGGFINGDDDDGFRGRQRAAQRE